MKLIAAFLIILAFVLVLLAVLTKAGDTGDGRADRVFPRFLGAALACLALAVACAWRG